jgi:hypothetical protein
LGSQKADILAGNDVGAKIASQLIGRTDLPDSNEIATFDIFAELPASRTDRRQ